MSIGTISAGGALSATGVSVRTDGLSELSPPDWGEDFLQAGTKHKNIAKNTRTQTSQLNQNLSSSFPLTLKNSQFYVIDDTINC